MLQILKLQVKGNKYFGFLRDLLKKPKYEPLHITRELKIKKKREPPKHEQHLNFC